jgi:hypothetical protein
VLGPVSGSVTAAVAPTRVVAGTAGARVVNDTNESGETRVVATATPGRVGRTA